MFEVYIDFYDKLVNILPVDDIAPELIRARVITVYEMMVINSLRTPIDKAQYVLPRIALSLEAGNSVGFLTLLDILGRSGSNAAASVASMIRNKLNITTETSKHA